MRVSKVSGAAALLLALAAAAAPPESASGACAADSDGRPCRTARALVSFESGAYDEARETLEGLLRQEQSPELLKLLSAVEEAAGDLQAAARALHRAAEIDPSEQNIFDLGAFLLRYQAPAEALKILEYGSERHPQSARLKVALGVALHASGRSDEAVEAVCAAIDLDPRDPRAIQFLGELYDVSPEMAAEVTRRLARFEALYPQNAQAAYYYALSLWKAAGERADAPWAEVERLLRRATELDEDLFEARYQLGLLYERLERWPQAIAAYEAAVATEPEYEQAFYRLGKLYQRVGRKAEAERAFARHRKLRLSSGGDAPR